MLQVVLGFNTGNVAQNEKPCTTWYYHNTSECECGSSLDGVVFCNNVTRELGVLHCYCMTSNGESGNYAVVGNCLLNCGNKSSTVDRILDQMYHPVSSNITDLDDRSCGYLNRKGRLCSQCKENFSVSVYSYSFQCIECPETNWIKYITVAFIPLTGFYFMIIIFSVSALSPKLKSFCFCAQLIASAPSVRIILASVSKHPLLSVVAKTIFSLYGFWTFVLVCLQLACQYQLLKLLVLITS